MSKIYIFLAVLVVVAIIVFIIDSFKKRPEIFPYQKRKYFMTLNERTFFEVLSQLINNQYFIFPQVHIASIVEVIKGQEHYMAYFNKIIRKSFDFVIFDKQNLNALLVIELDDASHNQPRRMERDDFVDKTLKVADLNILHIKPEKNYNVQELGQLIFSKLEPQKIDQAPMVNQTP